MRAPVYLESTLELIGVVDIDPAQAELLRVGRYLRLAFRPELPAITAASGEVIDEAVFAVEHIEFRSVPIHRGEAATLILTVAKREWLAAWPKQLWPRRRKPRNNGGYPFPDQRTKGTWHARPKG